VQINIGYGIIENENRVTGKSKIFPRMQKWRFLGNMGIHMRSFNDQVI
jgi:hypothetical protein